MGMHSSAHADRVDEYLTAQMAARHIPGLSVAVVQDGKVVKALGYGLADTGSKAPATPDTVYQIGSLTKQFTAVAVLKRIEQGKVGIDAPITQYIDGLPKSWKPITVRELLNQTSGLRNYREALAPKQFTKNYTAAEFIRLTDKKPLLFAPGSQFSYSNTNYHLLGLIVEKTSGQSYRTCLQQTMFGPLGMTHTQMLRPDSAPPAAAVGTLWDGKTVQISPVVFSPTLTFGDDGILSTVNDLVRWNAALDGETLLSPSSKRLLWTPPTLAGGSATEYASGWFHTQIEGHALLWHNGATLAGFTGAIFKFPDDKLTLIVLTNSLDIPGLQTSRPLYALTLGLAALYLPDMGKEDPPLPDPAPQTAALLKKVAAQLAAGKVDHSLFAPSFQALLTPATLDSLHSALAPLGPLSSLALLRRAGDGIVDYKALYGAAAVRWRIGLDRDGKISTLLCQSLN